MSDYPDWHPPGLFQEETPSAMSDYPDWQPPGYITAGGGGKVEKLELPCGLLYCEAGKLYWKPTGGEAVEVGTRVTSESMANAYGGIAWGGGGPIDTTEAEPYQLAVATHFVRDYPGGSVKNGGGASITNILGIVTGEGAPEEGHTEPNWSAVVGVRCKVTIEHALGAGPFTVNTTLVLVRGESTTVLGKTKGSIHGEKGTITPSLSATVNVLDGDKIEWRLETQPLFKFNILATTEANPYFKLVQLAPGF